jgi:hypothetical protein
MRRGSASGLASRRVPFSASAISGPGLSLVSPSSKIAPASRFIPQATRRGRRLNAAMRGSAFLRRAVKRRGETRMNAAKSEDEAPPSIRAPIVRRASGGRGSRDSDAKAPDRLKLAGAEIAGESEGRQLTFVA